MATSHRNTSNDDQNTNAESDRNSIRRILSEFGLDPSDYIFNSSSNEQPSEHSSAFTKYSPKQTTSIISDQPLTYAQQPFIPPPPPPIIKRPTANFQSPNQMSQRRTPPPPPISSSSSFPFHDSEIDDSKRSAEDYLRHIESQETPPVKVVKPNPQNVVYRKEIRIRYLQPPTPPPPAPIIIREKHVPPKPPESPLLIRERKPEPRTPPPLTIRERPPTPPPLLEPQIIDKPIPPPPPQPRQIIIERLPTPPPKPRTVIFEKWLPYKKVKRPILLQKASPLPSVKPVRNVIIEYEPLKAYTVRRVIEEGVFRVDPRKYIEYTDHDMDANVRMVDRIEDLPPPSEEIMRVLQNYNQDNSTNYKDIISSNVIYSSHAPVDRQERVLSPQQGSSIPSPTIVPLQSNRDGSDDSPVTLKANDIY